MNTQLVVVSVALVVLTAVAIPLFASAGTPDDGPDDIAPGEQFMGSVGVENAELSGEIDERALGVRFAQAADANDTADLIAESVDNVSARLAEIEQGLDNLAAQREEGNISHGQYQAHVAQLEAERASLERMANQTAREADGLPAAMLEDRGINVTAIQTLKDHANELSGQEVREIAQQIAGSNIGQPASERPDHADRAIDWVNETDDADTAIEEAARLLERAEREYEQAVDRHERHGTEETAQQLEAASTSLDDAESALDAAHDAEDGEAIELAMEAITAADEALEHTDAVLDELPGPPADVPGQGP